MRISRIILFCLTFLIFSFSISGQVTVETITVPFNGSGGVAIDDSGLVYVADFGQALNNANGTNVSRVLPDSSVVVFATGLAGASGNAFDSQGNLFQSNIAGGRISKITPNGVVSTFATNAIQGPVGVAVGPGDTVYVANCGNNTIAKITPNGVSSLWVSNLLLNCPNGLTIDDDGNLYTSNFSNGNVIKITPNKQISILAVIPGANNGHIDYFEGNLYVVGRCAQRIYKVTLTGGVTLIAGSGLRGNVDGDGATARFDLPNGIAARRVGNNTVLYVNDATSLSGTCGTAALNPAVLRKITIGPAAVEFQADADSSIVTVSPTEIQANGSDSAVVTITPLNNRGVAPIDGITSVTLSNSGNGQITSPAIDNGDGTFSATVIASTLTEFDTITVSVEAGGVVTELQMEPSLLYWVCGDIDANLTGPDIADLTFLIDALFINFPPISIPAAANIDCAGNIDIADLTALIDHLFINFPPLCCL